MFMSGFFNIGNGFDLADIEYEIECIIVILYSVYQLNCNLYTFIDTLGPLY